MKSKMPTYTDAYLGAKNDFIGIESIKWVEEND